MAAKLDDFAAEALGDGERIVAFDIDVVGRAAEKNVANGAANRQPCAGGEFAQAREELEQLVDQRHSNTPRGTSPSRPLARRRLAAGRREARGPTGEGDSATGAHYRLG